MKKGILLIFAALPLQFTTATELKLGDKLETTLHIMGDPVGTIKLREKTLLLYPQGEIVLKEDAVVEIDLLSDTAFEAEQARLEAEREEWLTYKARRAEARVKEGEAIRADKRESLQFAALPAKGRVDYWRGFQTRYPSIDVSDDLARALESYNTELAELKSQQRIAELESRVAKAEKETAEAKLETEQIKKQTARTQQSSSHGLRYYRDPIIQPRYNYRPPTVTILSNGKCVTTQNTAQNQRPDYWKFRNYNPNGTAERVFKILKERNWF